MCIQHIRVWACGHEHSSHTDHCRELRNNRVCEIQEEVSRVEGSCDACRFTQRNRRSSTGRFPALTERAHDQPRRDHPRRELERRHRRDRSDSESDEDRSRHPVRDRRQSFSRPHQLPAPPRRTQSHRSPVPANTSRRRAPRPEQIRSRSPARDRAPQDQGRFRGYREREYDIDSDSDSTRPSTRRSTPRLRMLDSDSSSASEMSSGDERFVMDMWDAHISASRRGSRR